MTRIDALNTVIATLEDGEVKDILTGIRESIAKSNARKSNVPTKTQKENAVTKAEILEYLATQANAVSIPTIRENLKGDYTSQKVSALLSQLRAEEKVNRSYADKGIAIFSLA